MPVVVKTELTTDQILDDLMSWFDRLMSVVGNQAEP